MRNRPGLLWRPAWPAHIPLAGPIIGRFIESLPVLSAALETRTSGSAALVPPVSGGLAPRGRAMKAPACYLQLRAAISAWRHPRCIAKSRAQARRGRKPPAPPMKTPGIAPAVAMPAYGLGMGRLNRKTKKIKKSPGPVVTSESQRRTS